MSYTKRLDLSVVLINYKTPHLLYDCINSIYKETTKIDFEIIVVDNNKDDGCENTLINNFPKVRYIDMGYNSGFARANNRGIKESKGEYILLLNDDTIILNRAIEKSLAFFKQEEDKKNNIGLLTCKFLNPDGSLQISANDSYLGIMDYIKPNPIYIYFTRKNNYQCNKWEQLVKNHEHVHEAKWLTGAFLLFNSKLAQDNIVFLDEDFLIYTEDMEISLRLKKLGFKTIYFPGAEIIHINSASYSAQRKSGQLIISKWLYILKTKGYIIYFLVILINYFNVFCDNVLFLKNKIFGKISELDTESLKGRRFLIRLLNKYSMKIFFSYRRKPSGSKHFLKYIP